MNTVHEFYGIYKNQSETDWEFCWRCICAKIEGNIQCDWEDIVEYFDLGIHRDSLRKAVNVGDFSAYKVSKYYEEKLLKQTIDSKSKGEKELDQKIHQLQMEKFKLKDERSALNKVLRLQARWQELLDVIKQEVCNQNTEKYVKVNNKYSESASNEAVLFVSDTHIGMTVNNPLNVYNKEVCIERFNKLTKSTITNCKRNDVKTLNIILGGDIIEGIINLTGRIQQNEDIVHQIFTASELLTEMIVELSNNIEYVNVWSTNGNHARMSKDAKEALDGENFESIVYEYIKIKIELLQERNQVGTNITLNDNDYPDMAIVHINNCNKVVAGSHGTKDRKAINNVSRINSYLPIEIDYYMMGHLHNSHHQNNCYVNGCFSGSSEWAQGQRYNNEPVQIMLVFFEDSSTSLCEMNLK